VKELFNYAAGLAKRAGKVLTSGQMFAKVLSPNDDSGRHGVLIPTDAYAFFPEINIPDPTKNATRLFEAFDALDPGWGAVAFKYYKRYPERRVTRVNSLINDRAYPRLFVALHARHSDGSSGYYFDCANAAPGGRFEQLFKLIFGTELEPSPGVFVMRPVDAPAFAADAALNELLELFDQVHKREWIDSLREGDTGIGYTFETLLGIKENNSTVADFKGIEIKCQGTKEGKTSGSSKINLFQVGPKWLVSGSALDRVRMFGKKGEDGLFSCHSQLSTTPNNLGLLLRVLRPDNKIDLNKDTNAVGYWSLKVLEDRLAKKHSRAAFVKAEIKRTKTKTRYYYKELVYCERPSIQRFVELVERRNIVFEFLMYEEPGGKVRNHGYPWRVTRAEFLDQLFAFQARLR
jgi:hypothetical protein